MFKIEDGAYPSKRRGCSIFSYTRTFPGGGGVIEKKKFFFKIIFKIKKIKKKIVLKEKFPEKKKNF